VDSSSRKKEEPQPQRREYLLSEAEPTHLQRLAEAAPTLKEAELRVLLHLVAAATRAGGTAVRASSRAIADATKTDRRAVQKALDSLAERSLIATRDGSTTTASIHQVNLLLTTQMSGPAAGPHAAFSTASAGATGGGFRTPPTGVTAPPPYAQEEGLFNRHPGGKEPPPSADFKELPAAAIDSRGSSTLEGLLDRVLRSKSNQHPEALRSTAGHWLYGHMKHLGRELPFPDERIIAQFLSVAPWPQLEEMLTDLMKERVQPGEKYAWFVAVAMQRIHGIRPEVLREHRAKLRVVKGEQKRDAEELKDIHAQVAHLAGVRRLR
jgi:DNA-binding MarR family transcriptional regulator